ncbi:MAG: ABC transporter ATP-binding protein [Planctomycetota bacterium]
MGAPAIHLDGVSKRYRIGATRKQRMLREALVDAVRRPFRPPSDEELIWALRDVSLEVGSDEVVGVIGRNGSGKTTLLKLLARITDPTEGSVDVRGRVASLVEVGTGFHNELTGRENVFLNGSIMGLKRSQIAESFDAIVDYSGVGPFIDTPIKRYSTGMRLRLGFAVAAHLFPDVLLVDEVLAVGDAEFQQKCLDTLHDVGRGGRTVMFVSHNLEAIESICPRTIWIDRGTVRKDGPSKEVIASYMRDAKTASGSTVEFGADAHRTGGREARFTRLELLDENDRPIDRLRSGDALKIRLHLEADRMVRMPYFGVIVSTEFGAIVSHPNSWTDGFEVESVGPGEASFDLTFERLTLMPGTYPITLWMNRHGDPQPIDHLDHCAVLEVHPPERDVLDRILQRRTGAVFFETRWALAR